MESDLAALTRETSLADIAKWSYALDGLCPLAFRHLMFLAKRLSIDHVDGVPPIEGNDLIENIREL